MGSPEGGEIAVWVCQEEKLVCGLTKRTSCALVVKALLEDHLANAGATRLLHAPAKDYCIVEKWRGFERLLPPATKLLRLWASWGEEQPNVHFVLVKVGASMAVPGLRSAEAKVIQNIGGQGDLSPAQYIHTLPADKQKRMVRKAFRKLAKMKKLKQGREGVETLVHLIASQDHTIRQQLQRMLQLDAEIEGYESWTHLERIQTEGENYVQETYLLESRESEGERAQVREYLNKRDSTFQLQQQIQQHEEAIEELSAEIQLEMARLCGAEPLVQGGPGSPGSEAERVESELETVMGIALQLRRNVAEAQENVQREELVLGEKAAECDRLVKQLQSLHLAEEAESGASLPAPCKDDTKPGSPRTSQPKGCSPSDTNDTDSDTGISSTHSQDSEPPCVEVVPALRDDIE
ncbi:ras association domain-containing protein 9 [Amblyraja radiata]|uniref:ras association domain-containing protein 9 n=1 Tax=Amblyraja radiata TaxID=386614 RepID=UPI001401D51B|nr:ras association domain-containing protein 9 [Amblyraja radiata]XP_032894086.1 ras association domain-containing protein 9 [Amblyraja radiata]